MGPVVELIPAVTYSDELDSDNIVRMGFVSPQIEQILGFPPSASWRTPASGSA